MAGAAGVRTDQDRAFQERDMKTLKRRTGLSAALALLVAACGGGGGGSSASAPPPTGGPTGPGATTPLVVSGAIDGFGSVIVNGVRYDTSSADVRIEDRAGSMDDLRVGQVVRIEAEVDDKGGARARLVEQHRLMQGTVQAVDGTCRILIVAGQAVRIDDDTSFDDSIVPGTGGCVALGERIEVHGFADSGGGARATRIERADAADLEIEVKGVVSGLDAATKRFRVGGLVVDYTTATLDGFGAGGPADGQVVEVKGRELLGDGTLRGTRVHLEDGPLDGANGTQAEVEGFVTRFVSATDFDVAGQRTTTNVSTTYVGGSVGDLALDVKVEAEGQVNASGVLVAAKVAFKHHSSVRIAAPVEAVDAAAGTFRALGVTIVVDAATRKEDQEGDDPFFGLDDLRTGDWVEVRGYPESSGSGRIVATLLERDEAEDEVELRGRAEALAAPRFRIAGVSVETTTATEFEDEEQPIDSATFFARAVGQVVEARGAWDGVSLMAERVEIEREDDAVPPPPVDPPPTGGNRAPVANAGPAQSVATGVTVSLDASASRDPDANPISYAWSLERPAGSAASLAGADSARPTFVADVAGSFIATVTVSDGQATSRASVTVSAQAPGTGLDGAALYATHCSSCHGPITAIRNMAVTNRTAAGIQEAINRNRGGMGFLSTLSSAEVAAIAAAIQAANP
jgi:mono/diheme cytochrome c family protein